MVKLSYSERQARLAVKHSLNMADIEVAQKAVKVNPVKPESPKVPTALVCSGHVWRTYQSVDNSWHGEDADETRVGSKAHPQHVSAQRGHGLKGRTADFGLDMTAQVTRTAHGTVKGTVAPTSPVEDREAYNEINAEINRAQHNARLIAASDLPKRTVKGTVRISANVAALNLRQVYMDGAWHAYECDGFCTIA